MSREKPKNSTPTLALEARPQTLHWPPRWLPEVAVLANVWKNSGLLSRLQKEVKVHRSRMGTYDVCDFVLPALAYTCGHEDSWRDLYQHIDSHQQELAHLWGRASLPSRSALSRFHQDINEDSLEALRALLFSDLLERPLDSHSIGGLIDRSANRHILFDVDGTRQTMRQRNIVRNSDHPPPRRRLSSLGQPGYRGRKRGEYVRTRSVVQQAHTTEWLGTFGGSGNGQPKSELKLACSAVCSYLENYGMPPSVGLMRLDGLYGYASTLSIVHESQLGFLSRCSDYGLLRLLSIPQRVHSLPACELELIDAGRTYQLYDLGWFEWLAENGREEQITCRLIVARTPAPPGRKKPRVGKREGAFVYELFVTNRDSGSLTPQDVVSLYLGRGGFEGTLAHEDDEQELDRWYSSNPAAQEWCQVLGHWVWNERLRLGIAAKDPTLRCTLWSEAQSESETQVSSQESAVKIPDSQEQIENLPPQYKCSQAQSETESLHQPEEANILCETFDEVETKVSSGLFTAQDFVLVDQETLRCPAGQLLRAQERRVLASGQIQVRFGARASDCIACEQVERCRSKGLNPNKGRRVTLPVLDGQPKIPERSQPRNRNHTPTPPIPQHPRARSIELETPEVGAGSVLYNDLPAASLRRFLPALLLAAQFELCQDPCGQPSEAAKPLSRAQRAHRRLNYAARLAKNALPKTAQPGVLQVHGLPKEIIEYLETLRQNAHSP